MALPPNALRLVASATLLSLALAARAQTPLDVPVRGWLRYAGGNVLSGSLVTRTPSGGVVRTDRFGDIVFQDGEAHFEAQAQTGAPPPVTASESEPKPAPGWRPASWSIGVSGYWQHKTDSTTSNLALDLDATWRGPRDELRLALAADYKVVDNEVDNNEQSGSLRWVRQLHGPWAGLGSVRLERSTFSVDPLPSFDYLLVQATAGLGWRQAWSADSHTLVALNYDAIVLDLLRLDRSLHRHATSLLLENHLRLGPKLHFDNTLQFYRWARGGGSGIDSTAELSYDLTDSIRVGLRHESRRNAVSLDVGRYSRVSLTTRVAF